MLKGTMQRIEVRGVRNWRREIEEGKLKGLKLALPVLSFGFASMLYLSFTLKYQTLVNLTVGALFEESFWFYQVTL